MRDSKGRLKVGVDIGGTFTDFVLVDEARDLVFTGKQLTTASDPGIAICEGVERIAREAGLDLAAIDGVVHGTTLVANTIIERTGARVGFITTRGFRDVLEVGTEMRYDLYDLFLEKAQPLAPRDRRLTVDERIDSAGTVLRPMDEAELREAARALVGMGAEAVAVCFVNSYVNPVHERRAREILAESFPALPLTVSTTVAPEIREYERACTAAANAYVMPLMRRYVTGLHGKLEDMGLRAPLNVMLSGGGIAALRVARETPIHLIESGPAAGAIAGAHYARITDSPAVIAFDMGGTTAKMCLIENGEPEHATTFEAGRVKRFAHGSGIPLKVPVIDLIEIGAGGGSIARLDAMGLMKVGPRSAGAEPGPVCYGRGGTEPTVTDADLWLGYLSADFFLGGEMPLDAAAVKEAMDAALSRPAGLDTTEAAAGVHAIVNSNMAAAARRHIAEKGRDPRRYALVATGGAGPVHAWGLARLLGIRRIVCPLAAGGHVVARIPDRGAGHRSRAQPRPPGGVGLGGYHQRVLPRHGRGRDAGAGRGRGRCGDDRGRAPGGDALRRAGLRDRGAGAGWRPWARPGGGPARAVPRSLRRAVRPADHGCRGGDRDVAADRIGTDAQRQSELPGPAHRRGRGGEGGAASPLSGNRVRVLQGLQSVWSGGRHEAPRSGRGRGAGVDRRRRSGHHRVD